MWDRMQNLSYRIFIFYLAVKLSYFIMNVMPVTMLKKCGFKNSTKGVMLMIFIFSKILYTIWYFITPRLPFFAYSSVSISKYHYTFPQNKLKYNARHRYIQKIMFSWKNYIFKFSWGVHIFRFEAILTIFNLILFLTDWLTLTHPILVKVLKPWPVGKFKLPTCARLNWNI